MCEKNDQRKRRMRGINTIILSVNELGSRKHLLVGGNLLSFGLALFS